MNVSLGQQLLLQLVGEDAGVQDDAIADEDDDGDEDGKICIMRRFKVIN